VRVRPELTGRYAFPALVALLLGVVGAFLARTTMHLHWPYDVDLYRDIGQAQWVREGHLLSDANYRGASAWYNPLLSWVVAGGSKLTGIAVSTLTTRGGVVLNLFAPITLTVLVARWFGRLAAGFTLVAFVFLVCGPYPSWAVATYSPWLFQANFAQGWCYLALLALPRAFERARVRDEVVLGLLIGLTALAHTAPAIILAVVVVAAGVRRVRHHGAPTAAVVRAVAVAGGTSFVVASPFLVPLAVRYRFHVRNELPTAFVWDELRNEHLARFAWDFGVRWPIVVGAGAAFLWWRRHRDRADDLRVTVLVTWTAAAFFALLLTCYGSGSLPGASAVPSVVPSYHWFLYLSAAMCVWFGIGVAALVRDLARVRLPVSTTPIVAVAVALLMVAAAAPQWRHRDERTKTRDTSLALGVMFDQFAVSRWIERSTAEDAVVLYDLPEEQALLVGALDGRRTVVVGAFFSNPFVDWKRRTNDAASMLASLSACRLTDFRELARAYGVDEVVTATGGPLVQLRDTCAGVTEAYSDPFATVLTIAAS